jgi:hypothetical protein
MISKGIVMESTAIQQMVDNIILGNQADAIKNFNDAMASKLSDALDDKKTEIASSIGKTEVTDDETV